MADNPDAAKARSDGKPGTKVATIAQLIQHPNCRERLRLLANEHLSAQRMLAIMQSVIGRNQLLSRADPKQVLQAIIGFFETGLVPNTSLGHGWIIPYDTRRGVKIEVIMGYQGMVELSYRSDRVGGLHADVVTKREALEGMFDYRYGSSPFLYHKYHPDRDIGHEDLAFTYAIAHIKGGDPVFRVMTWKDVLRARDRSEGYRYASQFANEKDAHKRRTYEESPWVRDEAEMAMKTAIRRLYKFLPKTAAMAQAARLDEGSEVPDFDLSEVVDLDPSSWTVGSPSPPEAGADGGGKTADKPTGAPPAGSGGGEEGTGKAPGGAPGAQVASGGEKTPPPAKARAQEPPPPAGEADYGRGEPLAPAEKQPGPKPAPEPNPAPAQKAEGGWDWSM